MNEAEAWVKAKAERAAYVEELRGMAVLLDIAFEIETWTYEANEEYRLHRADWEERLRAALLRTFGPRLTP